jgi:hypothetical protein
VWANLPSHEKKFFTKIADLDLIRFESENKVFTAYEKHMAYKEAYEAENTK